MLSVKRPAAAGGGGGTRLSTNPPPAAREGTGPRAPHRGVRRVDMAFQAQPQCTKFGEEGRGLAPKIGCYGWKRRLQTVTYTPNLVRGDPEM